jgi:hypothetical protein
MSSRPAIAAALLAAIALVGEAHGAGPPHRKVAVLEYRAGVEKAPDLAQRFADRLRRTAALAVADPQDARRDLPAVDADVARCSGEPACVARVGAGLAVDEVLLVGISQLGDLVLALQRIDVATATATARLSAVLPDGGAADDEALDGWLRQLYPPETFRRYGHIAVVTNVAGAEVRLNDKNYGETPLDDKLRVLAPRNYTVAVRKKGYLPFTARIDLLADADVEVRAELQKEVTASPWYKRWYFWAAVGGAAAAVAIGTSVGLTRPDTSHSHVVVVLPETGASPLGSGFTLTP